MEIGKRKKKRKRQGVKLKAVPKRKKKEKKRNTSNMRPLVNYQVSMTRVPHLHLPEVPPKMTLRKQRSQVPKLTKKCF